MNSNIEKNKIFLIVDVLLDAAIIFAMYYLAVTVRLKVFVGTDNADMYGTKTAFVIGIFSFVVAYILYLFSVHMPARLAQWDRGLSIIVITNTISVVVLLGWFFLSHNDDFSRVVIFLFYLFSLVALCAKYAAEQSYIAANWDKLTKTENVLVIGNGNSAKQYIDAVHNMDFSTKEVIGYLGCEKKEIQANCLGRYEDLTKILEEKNPDELVVALESHEIEYMVDILNVAEKEGTAVQMIPFFSQFFPNQVVMERYGNVNLINLRHTPLTNPVNDFIKRAFDLVCSGILILILSPLFVLVAIGVKLSSRGPVFFVQDRVGKDKQPFRMYKFRSMKVNGQENDGWTSHNDPRRTRFGTFLRRYSIDELPQLYNVFIGDMSLVGPRPEIPFYVRQFKETVPLYLVRQQVRPGMTGWAQVNGLRGDTSIEARVKYDIWYIENWSLFLDIKILLLTAFGGFKNNEE